MRSKVGEARWGWALGAGALVVLTALTPRVVWAQDEPAGGAEASETLATPEVAALRPTFPEQAYVLATGYLQAETGYEVSLFDGDIPTLHVLDVLAALGVAELAEVRLGWDYLAAADGATGIGDLTLAVKGGFLGGWEDKAALAGILEILLPTGTNGFGIETGVDFFGALVATTAWKTLQFDFEVGFDTYLFVEDPEFFLPLSVGVTWTPLDPLSIYGDTVVSLDLSNLSDTETSVLAGIGYRPIPVLELSSGARIGLSQTLPDVAIQVGVSWLVGRLW